MPVSKRFLTLLSFQLAQFADRDDLRSLIVYVAQPGSGPTPDLVPIGQWPSDGLALPTVGPDSPLRQPAEARRWLPLRHEDVLLGALQVETAALPWPLPLRQRLQAVALCLTQALCLDLERQQLQAELQLQREQLQLLLHQLRNPRRRCAPSLSCYCADWNPATPTAPWWKACWANKSRSIAT